MVYVKSYIILSILEQLKNKAQFITKSFYNNLRHRIKTHNYKKLWHRIKSNNYNVS